MDSALKGLVILIEIGVGRVLARREVERLALQQILPVLSNDSYRILAAEHPKVLQTTAFIAEALDYWDLIGVNRLLNLDIFERQEENCRELLAFLAFFLRECPRLVLITHQSLPEAFPRFFKCLLDGFELQVVRL